jgi:hypothetical protein
MRNTEPILITIFQMSSLMNGTYQTIERELNQTQKSEEGVEQWAIVIRYGEVCK